MTRKYHNGLISLVTTTCYTTLSPKNHVQLILKHLKRTIMPPKLHFYQHDEEMFFINKSAMSQIGHTEHKLPNYIIYC